MPSCQESREAPRDDGATARWARRFADGEPSDGCRYLNLSSFLEVVREMMRGAFGPRYNRPVERQRRASLSCYQRGSAGGWTGMVTSSGSAGM
jgi:hypothetical protein